MSDLAMMTFDRLMRHSYRFFTDNFAGTLVRRVNKFVAAFETIADQILFQLLPSVLIIAGSLSVLSQRDILLGITLSIGIVFSSDSISSRGSGNKNMKLSATNGIPKRLARLADAIGNSTTIKLFSGHSFEAALFGKNKRPASQVPCRRVGAP